MYCNVEVYISALILEVAMLNSIISLSVLCPDLDRVGFVPISDSQYLRRVDSKAQPSNHDRLGKCAEMRGLMNKKFGATQTVYISPEGGNEYSYRFRREEWLGET